MRFDALANLIGSADFATFREIARLALRARGYAEAHLTDGPRDGGQDIVVMTLPPNPTPIVVAVSVQQDWRRKLRDDARKAVGKTSHLLFISSRRMAQADFLTVADDLLRELSLTVDRMDQQTLAGLAVDRGLVPQILALFGIQTSPQARSQPPDLRRDAAYACAFFGVDAATFRKQALEHVVLAVLDQKGGEATRKQLTHDVCLTAGLANNQLHQARAAIDRLLQGAMVSGRNGSVALTEVARVRTNAARALREAGLTRLRGDVDRLLGDHLDDAAVRTSTVDAVMQDLGALLLAAGDAEAHALSRDRDRPIFDAAADKLRRLAMTLSASGLDATDSDELLVRLARAAADSDLGRHLLAGEVFLQLTSLGTSHLVRALGARADLIVALDASVAIPLACTLLHGATDARFFVAAEHLYRQCRQHGVDLLLPRPYLEEIAAHLLAAWDDYSDVVGTDADLRASKNAFVAHFTSLGMSLSTADERAANFAAYLEPFGLTVQRTGMAFRAARNAVMTHLARLLARYDIKTLDVSGAAAGARRDAEEDLAWSRRQQSRDRPDITVRHDADVLAWLRGGAEDPDRFQVLATWDRVLRELPRAPTGWEILDPVVLGDLLALAAPDAERPADLLSPVAVALAMSDEGARRGAAIWDALVQIERGRLSDADLLREAHAFKRDYLERTRGEPHARAIQEEWQRWLGRAADEP